MHIGLLIKNPVSDNYCFIDCEEAKRYYGRDVILYFSKNPGAQGLQAGEVVRFMVRRAGNKLEAVDAKPCVEAFIHENGLDEQCQFKLRGLSPKFLREVIAEGFCVVSRDSRVSTSVIVANRIRKRESRDCIQQEADGDVGASASTGDAQNSKPTENGAVVEDTAVWDPYGGEAEEAGGSDPPNGGPKKPEKGASTVSKAAPPLRKVHSGRLLLHVQNLPPLSGKADRAQDFGNMITPTLQMLPAYQPMEGKAILKAWCPSEDQCLMEIQSDILARTAVPILNNLLLSGTRLKASVTRDRTGGVGGASAA